MKTSEQVSMDGHQTSLVGIGDPMSREGAAGIPVQ